MEAQICKDLHRGKSEKELMDIHSHYQAWVLEESF